MTEDQELWSGIICDMVAEGYTLIDIAERLGCSLSTVNRRANCTPEATAAYVRARDAASDVLEAKIMQAAYESTNATAKADRVKIEALKWVASQRSARYRERSQVDHTSSDGSMTPKAPAPGVDLSKLPDEVIKALMDARTDN